MTAIENILLSAEDAFLELTAQEIEMISGGSTEALVKALVHISSLIPKKP